MMNNLFSMFDPSSSWLNLNWTMFIIPMLLFSKTILKSSKMLILMKMLINKMKMELNSMMEDSKKNNSIIILLSMFFFIFSKNFLSLFPFIFTTTSQISMTFSMAIMMWISFLIIGWMKNTKNMLAHLLPIGTPNILMPIMIMIEITSQLIRPITLSVRLTANMVAGHLLLSLLSNFLLMNKKIFFSCYPLLMILTFLEICVSFIQAFVFMTLLVLYSTEIK